VPQTGPHPCGLDHGQHVLFAFLWRGWRERLWPAMSREAPSSKEAPPGVPGPMSLGTTVGLVPMSTTFISPEPLGLWVRLGPDLAYPCADKFLVSR
jgi:hypothetical protein